MRSIFIHMNGTGRDAIVLVLEGYTKTGMYLDFYEDHHSEYEEHEQLALRDVIGDISTRSYTFSGYFWKNSRV